MSTVPPFKQYYANVSHMNSPQRRFYESWLNAWHEGQPIDVEGQVSYLFCYVYSVLGKGAGKALPELLRIRDAYLKEERFVEYCCQWILDCLVALGRYHEAIEASYPVPFHNPHSSLSVDNLLSLKLLVGEGVSGRDILPWFIPSLTKFGKKRVNEIIQYIDSYMAANEGETGVNILTAWSDTSRKRPYFIFNGTHLCSTIGITAYDFRSNEKVRTFVKQLTRDAENNIREKAGLQKVRMTAKSRPKKSAPPSVSFGATVRENLPYPVVYYPNGYGTFFGFAENESSAVLLCACSEAAIRNYLRLKTMLPEVSYAQRLKEAPLSNSLFPDIIAEASTRHFQAPLSAIRFEEGLCHRCNLIKPTLRYCHEMYGVLFVQYYGWYINQAYLRVGIYPKGYAGRQTSQDDVLYPYLPDICPEEYKADIATFREAQKEYNAENEKIMKMVYGPDRADISRDEVTYFHNVTYEDAKEMIRLRKRAIKLKRALTMKIENIVRQEFGFRKVGEGWVSETMLLQILRRILPEQEVLRHHRPIWLDGLELDIYFPAIQLAFEYQGQQHFHPIKAWGGEKSLRELRKRDSRKEETCRRLGVCLVTINYTEPLTEEHLRKVVDAKKPGLLG